MTTTTHRPRRLFSPNRRLFGLVVAWILAAGCEQPAEVSEDFGAPLDGMIADATDAAEVGEPDLPFVDVGCSMGELEPFARCEPEWAERGSIVGLVPDDAQGFYVVFVREDRTVSVERLDANGVRIAAFEGPVGTLLSLAGPCSGGVCFLESRNQPSLLRLLPQADGGLVLDEPEPGAARFDSADRTLLVDGAVEPTLLQVSERAGEIAVRECSFGPDAECALRSLPVECGQGRQLQVIGAMAWGGELLVSGQCSTPCDLSCSDFDSFVQPLGSTGEGWLPLGYFPDGTAPLLVRAPPPIGSDVERLWALTPLAPYGFTDDGGPGVTGFDLGSFDGAGVYESLWHGPVVHGAADPTSAVALGMVSGIVFFSLPRYGYPASQLERLSVPLDRYTANARTHQLGQSVGTPFVAPFGVNIVLGFGYPSPPTLIRFDANGQPVLW